MDGGKKEVREAEWTEGRRIESQRDRSPLCHSRGKLAYRIGPPADQSYSFAALSMIASVVLRGLQSRWTVPLKGTGLNGVQEGKGRNTRVWIRKNGRKEGRGKNMGVKISYY